jgi:hypothetical protein
LFKKIDSVLRGHVLAEIRQALDASDFTKALIVPANPSKKRTIKNGQYFIEGQPIHLTDFANDPEYPVKSANLADLLHGDNTINKIISVKINERLPDAPIMIGETGQISDLAHWAGLLNNEIIPAGGSDFFEILLQNKTGKQEREPGSGPKISRADSGVKLFVLSSAFDLGIPDVIPCPIPCKLESAANLTRECREKWLKQLESVIQERKSVVMTIGQLKSEDRNVPHKLREMMADIVNTILEKWEIAELLVSGGSTASSIVSRLSWFAMEPVCEYDTGVVSLREAGKKGTVLTVKPGSYSWPAEIITRVVN